MDETINCDLIKLINTGIFLWILIFIHYSIFHFVLNFDLFD